MGSAPTKAVRQGRYRFMLGLLVLLLAVVTAGWSICRSSLHLHLPTRLRANERKDIELAPRRGSIYDREGQPLAVSMEARTIYATPYAVNNPEATAEALADVLGGSAEEYLPKLTKDSGFVYIARKVDMDRAAAVEELELPGIGFLEDSRRTYPSGELACQILGFVGIDDEGLAGLESYYDELLGGTPGAVLAERDPFGRPIPGGVMRYEEPVNGSNVVLTIDKDIQYEAAGGAGRGRQDVGRQERVGDSDGSRYGEILAVAIGARLQPQRLRRGGSRDLQQSLSITDVYEPGSTLKSFTAAAVVGGRALRARHRVQAAPQDQGGRSLDRRVPSSRHEELDAHRDRHVLVERRRGQAGPGPRRTGALRWLGRLRVRREHGRRLPRRGGGIPSAGGGSGRSRRSAIMPFGQGISITQLQLARALAVIANGGELVTPHFLMEIPDDPGADLVWPSERVHLRGDRTAKAERSSRPSSPRALVRTRAVDGIHGRRQDRDRTEGASRRSLAMPRTSTLLRSQDSCLPRTPRSSSSSRSTSPRTRSTEARLRHRPSVALAEFSVSHLRIPPSTVREVSDRRFVNSRG